MTDPVYLEIAKRPVRASLSPEPNKLESEAVLPPLNPSRFNNRHHKSGVFQVVKSTKHLRRSVPSELKVLNKSYEKKESPLLPESLTPKMNSLIRKNNALIRSSGSELSDIRAKNRDMLKAYLLTK